MVGLFWGHPSFKSMPNKFTGSPRWTLVGPHFCLLVLWKEGQSIPYIPQGKGILTIKTKSGKGERGSRSLVKTISSMCKALGLTPHLKDKLPNPILNSLFLILGLLHPRNPPCQLWPGSPGNMAAGSCRLTRHQRRVMEKQSRG